MRCPVDKHDLENGRCPECHGHWIGNAILLERLAVRNVRIAELPWEQRPESDTGILCPECDEAMPTLALGPWEVERCGAHGVWFDADELEQMKHNVVTAGQTAVKPEEVTSSSGEDRAGNIVGGILGGVAHVVIEIITLPFAIISEL